MIAIMNRKENTVAIHLLILISLSILTVILFFQFSTEDSYITYRYAQNLARGEGLVYNPGEKFLGTTAPFYAFILAFFGILGLNIPTMGGLLSSVSLGMTVLLLYQLTLKKGYPLVGLLSGLFILLNPWLLQTFGSETFFQLLMVMCAFYFYDQEKSILTAIFCALAFLARADGIIPGIVIFADYLRKNKKFPLKEVLIFLIFCFPFFLFYYFHLNTVLPSTLEAKRAQYASGLWRSFLPGTLHFARLIVKENNLLVSFIPLIIIGGIFYLFSRKIWLLIAAWALLHTLGYTFLHVSFYHWYSVPLIFLLMLMSAFSFHFLLSFLNFFNKNQSRKWSIRILNQKIEFSISRFKDLDPSSRWAHRILSFVIVVLIAAALFGGTKAYYHTRRSLPFPKLQLYKKAGKWAAQNTPPDASIAFIEVGYFGYYSQRKVIDLVGLVTPGVSSHIRRRDFQWAVRKYKPDYFVYNPEFQGWLKQILDQPWFAKNYEQITEIKQKGFPFSLKFYKKTPDSEFPPMLSMDIIQDESNFPVGEIIKGIEIGQTFQCNQNHLTQIKVMLTTYSRKNHQDIIFHLKRSPLDDKDIYTEKFNALSVIDNAYRSFDFPPISDSKGKIFYFSLESPQSEHGDAITIWASSVDKYHKGALYINRKKSKGDLRFITSYYEY